MFLHLFLFYKGRTWGQRGLSLYNMKKHILIVGLSCLTFFTSCKSDAQKALDITEKLTREYIEAIRCAKTRNEAIDIQNHFEDRVLFEVKKIMGTTSEEEAEQKIMMSKDVSWEDIQRIETLSKEVRRVENEVGERLNVRL